MDERESIGTRLRHLRPEEKSCEQVVRELSTHHHFKLSREALDKFERDQRVPNGEAVVALAEYYGVTTDYLLGYSPIRESADQLQITAYTLGLSMEATEQLISLCQLQGERAGDVLSSVFESPYLPDLLTTLVKSKQGIERQRKHIEEVQEKKSKADVSSFADYADVFVLRAMRKLRVLLNDVLGYNKLIEEAQQGEHTES